MENGPTGRRTDIHCAAEATCFGELRFKRVLVLVEHRQGRREENQTDFAKLNAAAQAAGHDS